MSPLRVLHIIGGGDTGGAMSYVLPLVAALRERECDARLLCLGAGGLAEGAAARSLPHDVIPMAHSWDARILPSLRSHLADGGWDIIHTHGMRANLPVRALIRTVPRRPVLFTSIHSDLALDYSHAARSQGYVLMDRLSRPLVDAHCCVSRDLAATLVASGVPKARVYVVHPGLEPPGAVPKAPPVAGTANVGTVARLVAVKDIALFLEVLSVLRESSPGVRGTVIGDGPERARLEMQAAQIVPGGAVDFLGRVAPVWPALAPLEVFVITSVSEGIPLSVLEAMWLGIPVVATAVGGVPEVVEDGVTGFLVKREGDRRTVATALAARIADLLADPALRMRVGENARRRVVERFSIGAMARRMLAIYLRVIAGTERLGDFE